MRPSRASASASHSSASGPPWPASASTSPRRCDDMVKTGARNLVMGALLAAGCAGYHAGMPDRVPNPETTTLPLPDAFAWTSAGVLAGPQDDGDRRIVSVKDPSIVRFKDRWHLFATTADSKGGWSMVYLNFADWPDAATAP